ncbi:MAG: hypothetical protein GXO43_06300 [Crenarchaeota archaeon]|nr:hypothetical protein [Thermoproteota archaeon]
MGNAAWQLACVMGGISFAVGILSFIVRYYHYLEKGWISTAIRYASYKVTNIVLYAIVDSFASVMGYALGVIIGEKL